MRWPVNGIWANADYRRVWAAASVSAFGSQISMLAVPLLAAVTLHASALEMGILAAAQNAAVPVFGLFAGVLADHRRRKPLLVSSDAARALVLLVIPLAWWADVLSIPLLIGISFISGAFGVLFDVTHQAVVPVLVPRDQLVAANGKIYTSESAAELTGPGLSGVLVQIAGAPIAILLDAISYLGSAIVLARMKFEETPSESPMSTKQVFRNISEGFRAFWNIPILRSIGFCVAAGNLFESARTALLVLFMTRELDLSPAAIGILFALGGAGFLIGSLLPGWVAVRLGVGKAIATGLVILAAADLVFPFVGGPKPVAFAILAIALVLTGIGASIFDVNQLSLRQAVTPDAVRGRVNGTLRVMIRGIAPVGALIGGIIAEFAGIRAALIFAAFSSPVSLIILVRSSVLQLQTVPDQA